MAVDYDEFRAFWGGLAAGLVTTVVVGLVVVALAQRWQR